MGNLRILKIILVFLSLLILSSCGIFQTHGNIDNTGSARFQDIIDAIQNKDNEAIVGMFSVNALNEADDIEGGADYLFDFFQGDVVSTKAASQTSGSNHNGEKYQKVRCMYIVTTSECKYIVFYTDILQDTEDPDNVGLYMLQIIKEADRDSEFDWGGEKTKCAGIYRPPVANDIVENVE